MAVLAENGRRKLWFGTVDRMEWLPTPNRGADVSPEGWDAGGTLLNGGAYQLNSFASAKNYAFEWPSSSAPKAAQLVKSYFDGSYGRGLIYFVDPLTYDTNVLPAMWADPSMGIGNEATTLVPGVTPTSLTTSGNPAFRLPVRSAFYNLASVGVMSPSLLNDSNSVFIPIPEGYQMLLGSFYSYVGAARVFYSKVSTGGAASGSNAITPLAPGGASLFNTFITMAPGEIGIRLWLGKTLSGSASLTLTAMHARLLPVAGTPRGEGYWIGGQGHSGCRFIGPPTYVNFSGVGEGQVSYAASFREVGSWVMG